jgi:hypothetical protein
MRRPQFTLKSLLWLMACVICLFFGIEFERNWRHRAEKARVQAEFEVNMKRYQRGIAERAKLGLPP